MSSRRVSVALSGLLLVGVAAALVLGDRGGGTEEEGAGEGDLTVVRGVIGSSSAAWSRTTSRR